MENNLGDEVLFLLKQQRNLYHQLKELEKKQAEMFWGANSPEELVKILAGRRKLLEKLRTVNGKLKPIRANWQDIYGKIGQDNLKQAATLVREVSSIVSDMRKNKKAKEQAYDILSDTSNLACHFIECAQ